MRRKKISNKQEFSFENISSRKILPTAKLEDHSGSKRLRNKEYVLKALLQCLQDGDADAFKEILGSYLEVVNKARFAAETRIPERTLYRMVSKEGNPTLENIARVVHALCA